MSIKPYENSPLILYYLLKAFHTFLLAITSEINERSLNHTSWKRERREREKKKKYRKERKTNRAAKIREMGFMNHLHKLSSLFAWVRVQPKVKALVKGWVYFLTGVRTMESIHRQPSLPSDVLYSMISESSEEVGPVN